MIIKISEGDRVYCSEIEKTATVQSVYPEVGKAIIKTDTAVIKANIDSLTLLKNEFDSTNEEEIKKRSLLDKIKAPFKKSYD